MYLEAPAHNPPAADVPGLRSTTSPLFNVTVVICGSSGNAKTYFSLCIDTFPRYQLIGSVRRQLTSLANDLSPSAKQYGALAYLTIITRSTKQFSDSPPARDVGGVHRSHNSAAVGAPAPRSVVSVWFSNIGSLENKVPDFKALKSSFLSAIFTV